MIDNNLVDADYRCRVAIRTVNLMRCAMERNGNRYEGSLVPNLTSITDVLHLPIEMVRTYCNDPAVSHLFQGLYE